MLASRSSEVLAPAVAPAPACRHCGDACGDSPVATANGTFCCPGCESVYALIHAAGLAEFYNCEIVPGGSQRRAEPRDIDRFELLGTPEVVARLVRRIGEDHASV